MIVLGLGSKFFEFQLRIGQQKQQPQFSGKLPRKKIGFKTAKG